MMKTSHSLFEKGYNLLLYTGVDRVKFDTQIQYFWDYFELFLFDEFFDKPCTISN